MSIETCSEHSEATQGDLLETAASPLTVSLQDFVSEFGDELLDSLNRANPPVYTGQARPAREILLASLKRQLFPAQADVVHAVTRELVADRESGLSRSDDEHVGVCEHGASVGGKQAIGKGPSGRRRCHEPTGRVQRPFRRRQ